MLLSNNNNILTEFLKSEVLMGGTNSFSKCAGENHWVQYVSSPDLKLPCMYVCVCVYVCLCDVFWPETKLFENTLS